MYFHWQNQLGQLNMLVSLLQSQLAKNPNAIVGNCWDGTKNLTFDSAGQTRGTWSSYA